MKRILSIALAAIMMMLSLVTVSAEPNYKGLNEFMKSSHSDFVGQGGLTKTTKSLVTFDNFVQGFKYQSGATIDRSNKKEGSGCLSYTTSAGTYGDEPKNNITYATNILFSGTPGFNVNVTDPMAQSIGMWIYVDNIDNLPCDHDPVYNKFQRGCGTVYFNFGTSTSNYQVWQHTFYGSGWHYVEFALNSRENTGGSMRDKIKYTNMKYARLWYYSMGKPVTVKVDQMSLITYKTTASTPTAPYGGKWISTCDYNQLDGATVTEWLGGYFDTSSKTQGTSSLMIRGSGEHVDYRAVFAGYTAKGLVLDLKNDYLIYDFYCSDPSLIGTRVDFVFYDILDTGSVSVSYSLMNQCAGGKIKSGWNTIKVPLDQAKKNNVSGDTFKVERLKIYWYAPGTTWYTVGYDNMYLAPKANVDNPNWVEPEPEPEPESKPESSKPSSGNTTSSSSENSTSSSFNTVSGSNSNANSSNGSGSSVTSSSVSEPSQNTVSSGVSSLPLKDSGNSDISNDKTDTADTQTEQNADNKDTEKEDKGNTLLWIILGAVGLIAVAGAVVVLIILKKKKQPTE